MDNEGLKNLLSEWVEGLEWEEGPQFLHVRVPAGSLHEFARRLKSDKQTAFDYLFCLTGVDWPDCMEVIYHLESTQHGHKLVLKSRTEGREDPVLDTVCDIWPTADPHEREVFDLFGIRFNHHPDLRRILLTDEWEGYPLRKDYKDEINMIEL
ncbi:MAG: NADH-quinone oxidoreductase subunit C [Thermoanaerobaculia bacterium]|nr:NADH-quinone oxidoreductase subunit C [Thermoanaerobaculia bacterium]